MFRKLILLVPLVIAMGFSQNATAAVQDIPPSIADEFEGIESGYLRHYMTESYYEAVTDVIGTPRATADVEVEDIQILTITGVTFDSADNAEQAFDTFHEDFASDLEMSGSPDAEELTMDDLGDLAILHKGTIVGEDEALATAGLFVQDGEQVYMIQMIGGELDAGEQQVQDIAQFMLDGEIQTDEVTLNEGGTSTGGVFDLMPTVDDTDLIGDLVPAEDAVLGR